MDFTTLKTCRGLIYEEVDDKWGLTRFEEWGMSWDARLIKTFKLRWTYFNPQEEQETFDLKRD